MFRCIERDPYVANPLTCGANTAQNDKNWKSKENARKIQSGQLKTRKDLVHF